MARPSSSNATSHGRAQGFCLTRGNTRVRPCRTSRSRAGRRRSASVASSATSGQRHAPRSAATKWGGAGCRRPHARRRNCARTDRAALRGDHRPRASPATGVAGSRATPAWTRRRRPGGERRPRHQPDFRGRLRDRPPNDRERARRQPGRPSSLPCTTD